MATAAQIAHIIQHRDKWEALQGEGRSIEEYFRDYSHIDDLYERVCSDLGITPLPGVKTVVIRFPLLDAGRAERLQALLNLGPMSSHDVPGLVRSLLNEVNPIVTIEEVKP